MGTKSNTRRRKQNKTPPSAITVPIAPTFSVHHLQYFLGMVALFVKSIGVAVLVGEDIASSVRLANISGKRWTICLGVVGAGEDWVHSILVRNVGIEELADTGRTCGR